MMRSRFSIFCFCLAATLISQPSKINFSGKVKPNSDAPLKLIKAESNHLTGIVDLTSKIFVFSVKLKPFDGFIPTIIFFEKNYVFIIPKISTLENEFFRKPIYFEYNLALQKEHFHENHMASNKFPTISYAATPFDKPDLSSSGVYDARSKVIYHIQGITNRANS